MELSWQDAAVGVAIASAMVYLTRQGVKALRAGRGACGPACGCSHHPRQTGRQGTTVQLTIGATARTGPLPRGAPRGTSER